MEDPKSLRPGSGHSVLSPVKELRGEEDEDGHGTEEDEEKEEKEEKSAISDFKGKEDAKSKDEQDEDSSTEESADDSAEDSAKESSADEDEKQTEDNLEQKEHKEEEQMEVVGVDDEQNIQKMRPYTADATPNALEDPYVKQVLEARPMTAPEIGAKDASEPEKKKKRRIAFPKRKPKRIAKIKEKPKRRMRDPNEELSNLEIIKKAPEPHERDELEDLYDTWGGKRWRFLLMLQGIQCEESKMHRHLCSGLSMVSLLIFGAMRFYCFTILSGVGLALCDLAILCLGVLSQISLSNILYRNNLLKRLILYMLQNKGRDYFGRRRFKWCIYILPWTLGIASAILYNIFVLSTINSHVSSTNKNAEMLIMFATSIPVSLYFLQIVWHTIGLYVFVQLSLSEYILDKRYITRDLDNHVQIFYRARCMIEDANKSVGKYICVPTIPVCAIGMFQNILELYFVDNSTREVDTSLFSVFQVLHYGLSLSVILFFGGVVNESFRVASASISERMITMIEDDEKKMKLKARMGALGDDDPTTTRLDKHQKFPLLLFDLTLNSTSKNLTLMYSYVSNRAETNFKALGITLHQWHGILVGVIIISVVLNGI